MGLIKQLIIFFMPSLLAALVGAIVAHQIASKRTRIKATNELFQLYHSQEFITARQETWFFLDRINQSDDTPPFSELWSKSDKSTRREYNVLVQLVSFWLQLCMMKKQKEIDLSLARRLFSYQFRHWKRQLMPLYVVTTEKDKNDQPDWLTFMNPGEMDWLIDKKTKIFSILAILNGLTTRCSRPRYRSAAELRR